MLVSINKDTDAFKIGKKVIKFLKNIIFVLLTF